MFRCLFVVIIICFVGNLFGQLHPERKRANMWYFGWNAGLDFNSGSAVALTDGATMACAEGSSSICDTSGSILMYSNGEKVWNRNHQVMLNGYNLYGCTSSANGTLIVPQPGNDSLYYLFTADCLENNFSGLYYSIINIKGDGGLGQVITKNILLLDSCAESVVATYSDENNIWIVTSDIKGMYYSYLLSDLGMSNIVDSIQTTTIKDIFPSFNSSFVTTQKFSTNGKFIACIDVENWATYCILKLVEFDTSTGMFLQSFVINTINNTPLEEFMKYCSFSANSNYLYVNYSSNLIWLTSSILKFRIDEPLDSASIVNSIDTLISTQTVGIRCLQLSPLGNILINSMTSSSFYNNVSTFNFPESPNPSNLLLNSIYLNGKEIRSFFTNTIETWFCQDTLLNNREKFVESEIFSVFPNPNNGLFTILTDIKDCWSIKIVNILGKEEFKDISCNYEKNIEKVLNNGVYILEITDQFNKKRFKKFVIQN